MEMTKNRMDREQGLSVTLSPTRKKHVEYLKKALHSPNDATAVGQAVEMATDTVKIITSGDRLLVEKRNGEIRQLELPDAPDR